MIETAETTTPSWFDGFQAMLRRNPRHVFVLLVLLAILVFMWARLISGGRLPTLAEARATIENTPPGSSPAAAVSQDRFTAGADHVQTLADWASHSADKASRNLFALSIDDYPLDPAHPAQTSQQAPKSDSTQADQLKERQILIENLRAQAAKLTLEGVVLGGSPKAWVNGLLVGIGQPIGETGFRIASIEARRILIERDGIQIELAMK